MNFGDILDQWDRRTAEAKRSFRQETGSPAKWLKGNEGYDTDDGMEKTGMEAAAYRRRLRTKRPDALIDIHGLTRDEAWTSLEFFFEDARRRGLEKVAVIHGKGNHSRGEAVLGRLTRDFIERCPFAGESGNNTAAEGGRGATWVLLKKGKVFNVPGK